MLYDTHCHPNYTKQKDIKQILKSFKQQNKEAFLNAVGTNFETIKDCLYLANNNDFIYASIGIHPSDIDIEKNIEQEINKLEKIYLENKQKIIGIGECGLDYFHLNKDPKIANIQKEKQKKYFEAQIKLAKKYKLPIIIHNRKSKEDVYEILTSSGYKNFVYHCYSEDLEYANKLLQYSPDAMISFSGIVTFSNAKDVQNTAKNIALKNIMVETDAPWLTPTPFRGKEENEPAFTKYILDFICDLRDEDPKEIKEQIYKNSINFFKINKKAE